jgi:hypothetical protein
MFFDVLDLFSLGQDAILLEDGRTLLYSSVTRLRTAVHSLMRLREQQKHAIIGITDSAIYPRLNRFALCIQLHTENTQKATFST